MPAQNNMDERFFPTLYDYHNAENPEGLAIIDETYFESHFLTNAMMKPTNDGLRERFRRVDEMTYTPHAASLDEGHYVDQKGVVTGKELSFGTMRISNSITWDRNQKKLSDTNGEALKDKQMRALLDSMIKTKVWNMIYGKESDGNGLGINGLDTYLTKTYTRDDYDEMFDHLDSYMNPLNPFDTHTKETIGSEDLLCFSNQNDPDGGTNSSAVNSGNKFTSIYGVAFGETGIVTVFPEVGGQGGYVMDYTENVNDWYEDPRDGKKKFIKTDRYDIDSYFGIGVKNRYCLSKLKNIYLGHSNKQDRVNEMLRLEQHLILMKDFFEKGHTGMTMQFYCSDRLITEVERFQKEYYPSQFIATNSREFNGMNQRKRPKTINITSDIVLLSDSVFNASESYSA